VAAFWYSVVRYVPDPVRGEQINIGVVVTADDPPTFRARFLPLSATGRLKRIGGRSDFRFLRDLAQQMSASGDEHLPLEEPGRPRWTYDALAKAAVEWANTIQFSEVRAALHEQPDALLDSLYTRYVADPRPPVKRARDRRWVRRRVRTSLRNALGTFRPEADPNELILQPTQVMGEFEQHRFDFGLANGDLRRLVQTLSFETSDRGALKTEVDAVAWAIDDVRRRQSSLPISVVTIGEGKLLDSAVQVYEGLEASVVREHQILAWADATVVDLAATLH
jgi:hypothetical protein